MRASSTGVDRRFILQASLSLLPLTLAGCMAAGVTESSDRMSKTTSGTAAPTPPVAKRIPYSMTYHGITLEDPYHWLKDQSYPKIDDADVLAYLNEENAYFEAQMAPFNPLTEALFVELKGRVDPDEESYPARDGVYVYWWKFDPGAQYRKWYRRPADGGAAAVILDEPALAEGKEYFRLSAMTVSPDATLIAYGVDDNGSERFTIRVKAASTGAVLADEIAETSGNPVWAEDGSGFFYTPVNENWRPFAVRFHKLGTPASADVTVYEETDAGFFVGVGKTQSRRFITIATGDHTTSEVYLIPADAPLTPPKRVAPRLKDREYSVEEHDDALYILTNDTHPNFRLVRASLDAPDAWEQLIAPSDRHYLLGHACYKDMMVLQERLDGLDQVRVRDYAGGEHYIVFPEASYTAGLDVNLEYDIEELRLNYQSMVTPRTVFDYDLDTRTLVSRQVQKIPSGYDARQYVTERLMAPARDGAMVPVSIVYKKGFPRDGSAPVHLYGYGAYGYAMPPGFSSNRLSLLDRGFAYAIAHIRGGDDLGRRWYLDGRAEKRWNTFHDFIDCAEHLVSQGYASRGGISASGGSAGGKLMGVVVNEATDMWKAIAAHVPFVDVLNTMLDDSLPLTPMEWPEWGNPITDKAAFERILSYSPYENVSTQDYPPMLITGGLNDPRVTYWEPAKWTARLRAMKTDDNLLVLKTNMGAGHGGKSGRFARLYEVAEEFTFLLNAFGLVDGG